MKLEFRVLSMLRSLWLALFADHFGHKVYRNYGHSFKTFISSAVRMNINDKVK
jgi:hypothetical protein